MSSRRFIMLCEGLIFTQERSWLRQVVGQQTRELRDNEKDKKANEVRAVTLAQARGGPLNMADLQ